MCTRGKDLDLGGTTGLLSERGFGGIVGIRGMGFGFVCEWRGGRVGGGAESLG